MSEFDECLKASHPLAERFMYSIVAGLGLSGNAPHYITLPPLPTNNQQLPKLFYYGLGEKGLEKLFYKPYE